MKYIKLWLTLAFLGGVTLLQAEPKREIVDIEKLQKHKDDLKTRTVKKQKSEPRIISHQAPQAVKREAPRVKKHPKVTRVAPEPRGVREAPRAHVRTKHHPKRYRRANHQRCHVERPRHIHAYRVPQKRWRRAYINRHAPFYDRFGYFYGYFDQEGFMFEGIFRPYTRHYSYRDRVRGRSLFERRYYKPLLCRAGR